MFSLKSGEAKGVFHRDEIGDIGLIWGDNKKGLQHIINKHIITHSDFNSIAELLVTLEDVITNGFIYNRDAVGNIRIEKDGKRVVIAKNQGGDFVLTAYDDSRKLVDKKRSEADATLFDQRITEEMNGALVSSDLASEGKGSENILEKQADDSSISRIPVDSGGNPLYEAVDSDTAWDAIIEQTDGDEAMARRVVDSMVSDKAAALKKLQKSKSKGGTTIAEKIASEKERQAAIAGAEADLAKWRSIAGVSQRRAEEAEAERKAEEERLRAEQEEAERMDRIKEAERGFKQNYEKMGEVSSLYELILRLISSGDLKFKWGDNSTGTRGLGHHLGFNSESERRKRIWMLNNRTGYSPEQAAEWIEERFGYTGLLTGYDTKDVLDYILDVVRSNSTAKEMYDKVVDIQIREQERYEELSAHSYEIWLMENLGISLEEYASYEESVRVEIEKKHLSEKEYYDFNNLIAEETLEREENESRDEENQRDEQGGIDEIRTGSDGVLPSEAVVSGWGNIPIEIGGRVEVDDHRDSEDGAVSESSSTGGIDNRPTLRDVVRTLYSKGKEAASKLFSMKFFDVAQTPKFMQELGLRGDKFTIRYGVIARHLGKDASHTLAESDWEQLPQALQNPFAITKLTDKEDSYRIYTTLQAEGGEFVVVGAEVKNAGREIEVNAISTVFGRRNNANLPKNEEVIYQSKEITPEQSSLLERPDFAQYPTEQELSGGKDNKESVNSNESDDKKEKEGRSADHTKEAGKVDASVAKGDRLSEAERSRKSSALVYLRNELSRLEGERERVDPEKRDALERKIERYRGDILRYEEELSEGAGDSLTISQESEQVSEQVEPTFTEEQLENGDKRIVGRNSRGEIASVAIERAGKVVSVDSYDEGVLFEHTDYDSEGKAMSVIRYDKSGAEVSRKDYIAGKRAETNGERIRRLTKDERAKAQRKALEGMGIYAEVSLPRGAKWSDGKKFGQKSGRKQDSTQITALVAGDDLYIKGVGLPWTNRNRKNHDVYVIRNFRSWSSIGDFKVSLMDNADMELTNSESDAINSIFTDNGIGFNRRITRPIEKQQSNEQLNNSTDAQQLATESVLTALRNGGIEVIEASDAMVEEVLGEQGVEQMSVSEAKRRADEIQALPPIEIEGNTKTKEELREDYENLPDVKKKGKIIQFYHSAFKKIYKQGGLFAQIIPQLDKILEQSVLAYSEKDNRGGVVRPDGTIHKTHPNVDAFDNYVGKVDIDGKEYYVRTTVKRQEGESGTHSFFVTEVVVYEKSANGLSEPNFPSGESDHQRIIDAKLQQFFEYAKGNVKDAPQFSIVLSPKGVFYSNARKAVAEIKQDKATPQQWIAMLKKSGGLKAGEDAWLGLEEWLNQQNGSVSKQDILEYIDSNTIEIEEVSYSDEANEVLREMALALRSEYEDLISGGMSAEEAWASMEERYGEVINEAIEGGTFAIKDVEYALDLYYYIYGEDLVKDDQAINSTRLDYTTEGLKNNREIALTVPTVEAYNTTDEIHFGDAGEGTAVAWIRFGETTDTEGNRVLVIDEIQSKRHQDGREKGYKPKDYSARASEARASYKEAVEAFDAYRTQMLEKYGNPFIIRGTAEERREARRNWKKQFTIEELTTYDTLHDRQTDARLKYEKISDSRTAVPVAPFEKNWQELAMKRMLRYAAENGFAKVAWTTGEQQAKRYDIGNSVSVINRDDTGILVETTSGDISIDFDNEGKISIGQFSGGTLSDVFGKEIADKILNMNSGESLSTSDLHIGGEGMKGFYDRMLPSFMNKYGKKWGVKVGEVTMPGLAEGYQTMHSVEVTSQMRDDVMQGQPMFFRTPRGVVYGWTIGGKIYLTPHGMNPNTPIHEYTHLWANAMMQRNPKGWESVKTLLRGTPIWTEVMTDSNYSEIQGNEDLVASECLSRLSGKENAAKLEAEAERMLSEAKSVGAKADAIGMIERMKRALQKFWNWVGTNLFEIAGFDSIEQVTDRVLYDLLSGTDMQSGVNKSDDEVFYRSEDAIKNGDKYEDERIWREIQLAESDRQYIKAKEILDALHEAGHKDFRISRSITDWGVSTYIQGMYDMKIRLSDHSVSSTYRTFHEYHIDYDTAVDKIVEDVNAKAERLSAVEKRYKIESAKRQERIKSLDEKWERIKEYFKGQVFYVNERTYQHFNEFEEKGNGKRRNILQTALDERYGNQAFRYEYSSNENNGYGKSKPSYEYIEAFDEEVAEIATTRYRTSKTPLNPDDVVKGRIEALFNQAISGEFKGKPISIGRLTNEGKAYLEQISGISFKDKVDFVLNPSDLVHIYKDHFGNNEKDKGQNIPLDIEDIRSLADVISSPDKVIFFKEGEGLNRNMFYFFKEAEDGTYNLMEIYSDRKGNLTAKTFYKTRKDASQRVMDIEKSLLPTSETYFGAILSDANIPQMFESTSIKDEFSTREGDGSVTGSTSDRVAMRGKVDELSERLGVEIEIMEEGSGLSGKKSKSKGFFNPNTGKVTIILGNNRDLADVEQTVLHEAVAHYGLRQLFGEHFDRFLDNIYEHSEPSIRRAIDELANLRGYSLRTATEEYLAKLAEDSSIYESDRHSWLHKVRAFFRDMLMALGFEYAGDSISFDEIRYILWRSYENLTERGGGLFGEAKDVSMQHRLGVGEYAYRGEENAIEQINGRFNAELESQMAGKLPQGHIYELGMPGEALLRAGLPNLPIEMSSTRLAEKSRQDNHPFALGEVRDLVRAIQEPMAVFRSATRIGSYVVLTEIEHNGKNYVVAIETNRRKGKIEVNDVRSVYPKTNSSVVSWIEDDLLEYADKEKMSEWISKQRSNSAEVRNRFRHVAKIVEKFENRAIEEDVFYREGEENERGSIFDRARGIASRLFGRGRRATEAEQTVTEEPSYFDPDEYIERNGNDSRTPEEELAELGYEVDAEAMQREISSGNSLGYINPEQETPASVAKISVPLIKYQRGDISLQEAALELFGGSLGLSESELRELVEWHYAKKAAVLRVVTPTESKTASERVLSTESSETEPVSEELSPLTGDEMIPESEEIGPSVSASDESNETGATPRSKRRERGKEVVRPDDLTGIRERYDRRIRSGMYQSIEAIQDSMAVFRSATRIGSYVVLTEIEHNGKNYVVAIETNRRKGKIEVNSVRSVHYRTSNIHFVNWIEDGLLEYADKEKMSEWISKQRYNSADVRNRFRHVAKIVEKFENRAIEEDVFNREGEENERGSIFDRARGIASRLFGRGRRATEAEQTVTEEPSYFDPDEYIERNGNDSRTPEEELAELGYEVDAEAMQREIHNCAEYSEKIYITYNLVYFFRRYEDISQNIIKCVISAVSLIYC